MPLDFKKKFEIIHNNLLLLFVLLIPVSQFLSIRILVIIALLTLLFKRKEAMDNLLLSWESLVFVLILIFGLLYTNNIKHGLAVLETSASLIIAPIAFGTIKHEKEFYLRKVVTTFIVGVILACCVCLINAFMLFWKSGDTQNFFFSNLTSIIDSHPTYLAYYIIFAITIILYYFFSVEMYSRQLLLLGVIVLLFLVLLLTGGSTAFVSMLFVFSFFILRFFLSAKTKISKLIFAVVVLMIFSMLVASAYRDNSPNHVLDDSWDRFFLWELAIQATPNIFFGAGTGDYSEILNNHYRVNNLIEYANSNFNSHNQFIQIVLSNGLFGLIALIILVSRPIYIAVLNNLPLGTLVFFSFIIYGVTEVFLGRYQGVVFFALLQQLFLYYNYSRTNLLKEI
jgi:O-antigen ligase